MQQNRNINKQEFIEFYNPIIKGYSESFKNRIDSVNIITDIVFKENKSTDIDNIIKLIKIEQNHFLRSYLNRFIAVREIIYCRENKVQLNVFEVWCLVANSIRQIPSEYIISSIGSQGFLSIPLYKLDLSKDTFDFLRLHIWDDSLNEYMDLKKCDDFSIHSHTFFAKSWIITGKVINDRYNYSINSKNSDHSFFKVVYNNSLNEVNQHTSKAVNKNIDVEVIKTSSEVHFRNGYYEIEPSKLHKSGHINSPDCSATFFSFTGKDGLGESFVIGPKQIQESEINRKTIIDPIKLIEKIDKQLGK